MLPSCAALVPNSLVMPPATLSPPPPVMHAVLAAVILGDVIIFKAIKLAEIRWAQQAGVSSIGSGISASSPAVLVIVPLSDAGV